MTKQRKSILSLVTSIALAMILSLSLAMPAFAEISEGENAKNPAEAALTKIFRVPVNTDIPDSIFTFTFTKEGVNEGTDKSGMPDLGTNGIITVTFEPSDEPLFTVGEVRFFVKQTDDFLNAIADDGSSWVAGAGVYRYTVKEEQSGITPTDDPNDTEFPVYSKAEYEIKIYVEEDDEGVLFARYVVGYYKAGKSDEYYTETPGDGKLDPTPGKETPETPAEIGGKYSDLIFTNRYSKTDGTTTNPGTNALEIKKVVTGNNPDYGVYYEFNVTVITPDAIGTPKPYNAYIVDEDGNYVDLDDASNPNTKDGIGVAPAPLEDYITFTSGNAGVVELKHGQSLIFFDLEVGAEVKVFETVKENTRVKYNRTFGQTGDFLMPIGALEWGFPRAEGNLPEDSDPVYTKAGAGANVATFTNNQTGLPPTGISVDDLPYVVLIGLALAGLAVFVALKTRKRGEA